MFDCPIIRRVFIRGTHKIRSCTPMAVDIDIRICSSIYIYRSHEVGRHPNKDTYIYIHLTLIECTRACFIVLPLPTGVVERALLLLY